MRSTKSGAAVDTACRTADSERSCDSIRNRMRPSSMETTLHALKVPESAADACLEILRMKAIEDQQARNHFVADQAIHQPGARIAVARRHFHHALESRGIQIHDGCHQFLSSAFRRGVGHRFQFGDQRLRCARSAAETIDLAWRLGVRLQT